MKAGLLLIGLNCPSVGQEFPKYLVLSAKGRRALGKVLLLRAFSF